MSAFTVEFDGRERALAGDIRLDGREIDLIVGGALVSFDEELTVDGSPIIRVGVLDTRRRLIRSGLLDLTRDDADLLNREVELIVDGVGYWLRDVNKQSDIFNLTFEDRTVCLLRDQRGAMKVSPDTLDHRGFIARLCSTTGVAEPVMRAPGPRELAARASSGIGSSQLSVAQKRRDRDERRAPGLPDNVRLTVKGAVATPGQLEIASQLLSVADEMGAGPKATLALVLAGIVESELSNPGSPSADGYGSYGTLQARVGVSRGARGTVGSVAEARDVEYMAQSFLIDKPGYGFTSKGGAMWQERSNPAMTAGQIAQAVEGSAYPDRYDQHQQEGRAIVSAFFGGELPMSSGLSGGGSYTRESPLTVEAGENYWEAARRIAESYGFRCFVVANRLYYLADEALMRSRPRMTVGESTPGVYDIDWEWAPRRPLRQTDLTCNVRAWKAPPGSVVILDESCGPAAGRWLVGEYSRSRFEAKAQISLIKGRKPTVPTETVQVESPSGASGSVPGSTSLSFAGGAKGIVDQAAALAIRVAGSPAYVSSTLRNTTTDHGGNDSTRAARDIALPGVNPTGPGDGPIPQLNRAAVAVAAMFGRTYAEGQTIDIGGPGIVLNGYRIQMFWRTDTGGNHWNHIHVGARKL